MGVFAAAACAAFLMSGVLLSPDRTVSISPRRQFVLGATVLAVILAVVFVLLAERLYYVDLIPYVDLSIGRLVASGPEPLQMLLGLMFGVAFRFSKPFAAVAPTPPPPDASATSPPDASAGRRLAEQGTDKATTARYRSIGWPERLAWLVTLGSPARPLPPATPVLSPAAADPTVKDSPGPPTLYQAALLVTLLILGVASPYVDPLLANLTTVKFGGVEATFGSAKENRRLDVSFFRRPWDARTSAAAIRSAVLPTIEADRLSIALDLDALATVPPILDRTERDRIYRQSATLLRQFLLPVATCIEAALADAHDRTTVQEPARRVALALRALIRDSGKPSARSDFGRSTRDAHASLLALVGETPSCKKASAPPAGGPDEVDVPVAQLVRAPYLHLALAHLLRFSGNAEASSTLLQGVAAQFARDMNVNYFLGQLAYSDPQRNFADIFKHYQRILLYAQGAMATIDAAVATTTNDARKGELSKLRQRYEIAAFRARDLIAELAAEEGQLPADALEYAKENYGLRSTLPRYFADDPSLNFWLARFIGTYGYVRMVLAAKQDPPDAREIEEGKRFMQSALTYAKGAENPPLVSELESRVRLGERLLAKRP